MNAVLVQVFCRVVSTPKFWQWNKFYLLYFRRTKNDWRGTDAGLADS